MAPREVYGCSQFWKGAGSDFLDFGVWPLGLRPADSGVSGHNDGVPCGARGTATKPARPMAPAVPRASWAPPGHSYRWLSLDTFSELVFGARGGYLHPRGQNNDFPCSGQNRGVWARKARSRAVITVIGDRNTTFSTRIMSNLKTTFDNQLTKAKFVEILKQY